LLVTTDDNFASRNTFKQQSFKQANLGEIEMLYIVLYKFNIDTDIVVVLVYMV